MKQEKHMQTTYTPTQYKQKCINAKSGNINKKNKNSKLGNALNNTEQTIQDNET